MKGGSWTAIGAVSGVVNNFTIILLTALLLGPTEVGYLSIFLFFNGLFAVALPLGNNYRYVIEKDIGVLDYLIGLSLGVTLMAAAFALIALSSYLIEIELLIYTTVAAGIFCGFLESQIHSTNSILQRELNYKSIEKANITKNSLSLILAIIGIYAFENIQASYAAKIMGAIMCLIMTMPVAIKGLRTGRSLKYPFSKTSAHMASTDVIGFISGNAEAVFALPQIGVENYGIYNFGKRLVSQPRDLIGTVIFKTIFPAFARVSRSRESNGKIILIRRIYNKSVRTIAEWGLPTISLLIVITDPLIFITLGDEWKGASQIVIIFAISAIIYIFGSHLTTALLTALGETRIVFRVELVLLPIRIALIYFSSFYGILYVALSMNIVQLIKILILNLKAASLMDAKLNDVMLMIARPAIITLACSVLSAAPLQYSYTPEMTLISALSFISSYILLSYIFNRRIFDGLDKVMKGR